LDRSQHVVDYVSDKLCTDYSNLYYYVTQKLLNSHLPDGCANLYLYFIEKAVKHLMPGGDQLSRMFSCLGVCSIIELGLPKNKAWARIGVAERARRQASEAERAR